MYFLLDQKKTRNPFITTTVQHVWRFCPVISIEDRKTKILLFADVLITYKESYKIKILLELIKAWLKMR